MYELGFPDMVSVFGRSMSLQEAGQWGALAALVAGLLGLAASVQAAQERVCGPDLLPPCALLVSWRCTRLRWHPLCTKAERPCMLLRVFQANFALRRCSYVAFSCFSYSTEDLTYYMHDHRPYQQGDLR